MTYGSRTADQVIRRENFCRAHPEVSVEYQHETWHWKAVYPDENGTAQALYASELRDILDKLERRFA